MVYFWCCEKSCARLKYSVVVDMKLFFRVLYHNTRFCWDWGFTESSVWECTGILVLFGEHTLCTRWIWFGSFGWRGGLEIMHEVVYKVESMECIGSHVSLQLICINSPLKSYRYWCKATTDIKKVIGQQSFWNNHFSMSKQKY